MKLLRITKDPVIAKDALDWFTMRSNPKTHLLDSGTINRSLVVR